MTISSPLLLSAGLDNQAWRDRLVGPRPPPSLRPALRRTIRSYLEFTESLVEDDAKRLAILAGTFAVSAGRSLIEFAFMAERQADGEPPFVDQPSEVDYLRDGRGEVRTLAFAPHRPAYPALVGLRRLKAPLNWTPWWRLAKAICAPDIVISFNSHLQSQVKHTERAASAHDANQILLAARASAADDDASQYADLAAQATRALCAVPELRDETKERLRILLGDIVQPAFAACARDLSALSQAREMPTHVLSGSGAPFGARAVGLEVLRRGGGVERYEHGGPLAMVAGYEGTVLADLAPTSRYMVMSEAKVSLFRGFKADKVFPSLVSSEIVASAGDDHFRAVPHLDDRPRKRPKQIVYGTTVFKGLSQYEQPLLSDLVYLDWQLRLAEIISELPVDLVLKPHPQTPTNVWHHHFSDLCHVSMDRFESLMDDADIFICDYPQTTTFWLALCSDRPVLLLDLGISPLNPVLDEIFSRRCTIIKATYDETNLPHIDVEALVDAILSAPHRVDSTEIRHLLIGDGS